MTRTPPKEKGRANGGQRAPVKHSETRTGTPRASERSTRALALGRSNERTQAVSGHEEARPQAQHARAMPFDPAAVVLGVDHPDARGDDDEVVDVGPRPGYRAVVEDPSGGSDRVIDHPSHVLFALRPSSPGFGGGPRSSQEADDRREQTEAVPPPGLVRGPALLVLGPSRHPRLPDGRVLLLVPLHPPHRPRHLPRTPALPVQPRGRMLNKSPSTRGERSGPVSVAPQRSSGGREAVLRAPHREQHVPVRHRLQRDTPGATRHSGVPLGTLAEAGRSNEPDVTRRQPACPHPKRP